MKSYLEDRIIREAETMIENNSTIRAIAEIVGVSKSTVYKDISERLPQLNYGLYIECCEILAKNKQERHIRGGQATKAKYSKSYLW